MDTIPDTRYAERDGSFIAYQVLGEGPPDILFNRSGFSHLEIEWEEPRFARFLRRLASFGRLIVFDHRGTGLSDPFFAGGIPTYEDWADDIMTVMDAVGSQKAAVVFTATTTARSTVFVAAHTERVTAIVACDCAAARTIRTDEDPIGADEEIFRRAVGAWLEAWGRGQSKGLKSVDPALAAWAPRLQRFSTAPGTARLIVEQSMTIDIRHLLPLVRVPTLVVHHANNAPENGRYLAAHIEGSKFVELPGDVHLNWCFSDPDAVAVEIARFLIGREGSAEPDRVLATVLFTDIVSSTRSTVEAGDTRWRDTLDRLDRVVADQVEAFRGRVIKSTGDGHLATFDGPGRAIRCAIALGSRAETLGLTLRAGLHTGEVEIRGNDLAGIAVSIARRVCDTAADGCVFVSSSVPPLVAGSQIEFAERGARELKGVPGSWQLYEVVP